MNQRIKKMIVLCVVSLLLCICVGCDALTQGYVKFEIKGFEEFFILTSPQEKDEYIDNGALDSSKKEDILLVPFMKEAGHEECVLLLTAYTENTEKKISIERITISTKNGVKICCVEEYGELDTLSVWSENMTVIETFDESEKWFFDGNDLIIEIEASVLSEQDCTKVLYSYDVTIVEYRGPSLQA